MAESKGGKADARGFWNQRYAAADLVWGIEPNRFVAEALASLGRGDRVIDLACGEGRNAIWLASRGCEVVAVDFSEVAIERAKKLAGERDVEVDWVCADVTRFEPASDAYDCALIVYLQLPGDDLRRALMAAARALRPGAEFFAIGHARRNLAEGFGGPQDERVLWEPDVLRAWLEELGFSDIVAEHVLRPVEGERDAIDVRLRARLRA